MIKIICSGRRSNDMARRANIESDIFKAKGGVGAIWGCGVFARMAKKEDCDTHNASTNRQCLNDIVLLCNGYGMTDNCHWDRLDVGWRWILTSVASQLMTKMKLMLSRDGYRQGSSSPPMLAKV
jgi:hypothetical protein